MGAGTEDHFSVETFRTKHFDFLSAMGEGQRVEPEMGIRAHEWPCFRPQAKTYLPSNREALQAGARERHLELTSTVAGRTGKSLCNTGLGGGVGWVPGGCSLWATR